MKNIVIIVGTRPNFIKITQFEKEFNKFPGKFKYRLVHTGQHYDTEMSDLFFGQLNLKRPDIFLNLEGLEPGRQIAKIIDELSTLFLKWKPDLVIVPGDVNSTLAASIAANKTNTRLAHLESGLRSFDKLMPEEHNRVITDWLTNDLFITETSGLINLRKEGKEEHNLHFVGNTMIDTLTAFNDEIEASDILNKLGINKKSYALMTMHRPSNVDTKESLSILAEIIKSITQKHILVFPIHPRTIKNLKIHKIYDLLKSNSNLKLSGPLDYLSFQKLIAHSTYVITDSGGIQEETTFRQIPCLTLRNNTERPVTITQGTNKLVKFEVKDIIKEVELIQSGNHKKGEIPEFWDGMATSRVVKILHEIL